jgi:hypothetical protein
MRVITSSRNNIPHIEIGTPWLMNPKYYDVKEDTLPTQKFKDSRYNGKYRFTNMVYANLYTIDLIPIVPKVDSSEIKKVLDQDNKSNDKGIFEKFLDGISASIVKSFKPDYQTGRKVFNFYLKDAFKILDPKNTPDIHYVRLYATDNTNISEAIQSNYEVIELGQAISHFINYRIEELIGKVFGESVKQIVKVLRDYELSTYYYDSQLLTGEKKDFTQVIQNLIYHRHLKIDFPKRWVDTTYNKVINLNVTLSSPYGHPDAVNQWIVKPLLTLLLLAAPANIYGLIGLPLYVRVKGYGLFDIPLGAIQSIIIDRGGSNTKFNIYKQPLKINLTISIVDLYNHFSIDALIAKENNINLDSIVKEKSDITKYEPSNDKIITTQQTITNLTKSFQPAVNSNYEPKSSYIKSYKIKIKKK